MHFLDRIFAKGSEPASMPACVRSVEHIGNVLVIRLQGDVGTAIASTEREAMKRAEEMHTFERPLLLDFSGVTSTDFSTVSYLVESLRMRMTSSARVAIIHPTPQLMSELQIAKLGSLFGIYDSEREALAALDPPDSEPAQ